MSDITNQDMTTAIEPAAERITLALIASVGKIARANGYWKNAVVYRPTPAGAPPIVDAGIEVSVNAETVEDAPGDNIEQIRVSHYLTCDVVTSEKSTVSIDTLLHRIKADVKKAIMADPFLGGLAMDTTMRDALFLDVDNVGHQGRIIIESQTVYRTLLNDPYEIFSNPA